MGKKRRRSIFCLGVAVLLVLAGSWPAWGQKNTSSFRVLDIGERTYQGSPAVAVLFSEALSSEIRHDKFFRISNQEKMLKSVWVLSQDGHTLYFPNTEPQSKYSVTVMPELTSAKGHVLGKRISKIVKTREMPAGVSFAEQGFILPAELSKGLPLTAVNVDVVNIEFFRINEQGLVDFVHWSSPTGKKRYYKLRNLSSKYGELVYSGRFELDLPKNKRVIRNINIKDIEALNKPGVYIAVLRRPGEYEYRYSCTYFLVTDIGLHLKVYADRILLAASSINTGRPIQGAELSFLDKESRSVLKGKTGAKGIFEQRICDPDKLRLIKARAKGQIGILPLQIPALDLSAFDLKGREFKDQEVYIYSPRDLYRPGEEVIVSALLRDYQGKGVSSRPLQASLIRPDNRKIQSFNWQPKDLNATGINYFQKALEIPKKAQTGKWRLEVRADPESAVPIGQFAFHVEEFLPERMKLELKSKQDLLYGDSPFEVEVKGEYLYGAAAAKNLIQSRVFVRAERQMFSDFKDFEFGLEQERKYTDYWKMDKTRLDGQGQANLELKNHWAGLKSPMAVQTTISLFESGGRPVKRTIKRIFFPAKELVGVRKLFEEDKVDQGRLGFEIINVDRQGRLKEAENLILKIIKQDRDYFWEYSDSSGWSREYTERNYTYLTESFSFNANKPYKYTADLDRGRYVLKVKNPNSGQMTSLRFRVGYWWGDAGGDKGGHPEKVLLKLDQRSYLPGDEIELTVTPPHSGQALILVEGDKPLWSKRTNVSANGTVVRIPVSAAWDREDIYISALCFRPAESEELITPKRAVGLIHLPLNREKRELDLSLEAPKEVSPQDKLQVKLKLKQKREKAYVTLAAVDVGVLNITGMQSPRPFEWFFAQRNYNVLSYDIYSKIIETLEGRQARVRFGGDADLRPGGKRPETKVEIISLFQGPVSFDSKGEASIGLDLPNFNGRMRLMAVAFTKDDFGSAEKEVQVAAPIVTQLSTPRFLAPGDRAEFSLDVHNLSGEKRDIQLELKAESPLSLTKGKRNLTLIDQEKEVLSFPVQAEKAFGSSRVKLVLQSKDFRLIRDWTLGVRPGYPGVARKKTVLLSRAKGGQAKESLRIEGNLTEGIMPSTLEADLKISPVPAIDLKRALQGLIKYPYGCLEQITSRSYPLIYARSQTLKELNLPGLGPDKRLDLLRKGIERISSMQKSTGGFGQWSKDSREAPWLTVYAADFLLYARAEGLEVSQERLEKALKRVEEYFLQGPPIDNNLRDGQNYDFAVRSYAGYVLSRLNRASLGTLRTIFDNHKQDCLTRLPLFQLKIALNKMGDSKLANEALTAALNMQPDNQASWSIYGSQLRDTALGLALLLEHGIEDNQIYELMYHLQNELRKRQYLSTQEKFALFKAGIMLKKKKDKKWTAKVRIGSEEKRITHKGAFIFEPDLKKIQKGIEISPLGNGTLFANALVSGYTKTAPEKEESGMRIERTFYDLEGQVLEKREFNIGEMVLVRLDLRAEERIPDALAVDLLPAGLEIENQNLRHSMEVEELQVDDRPVWKFMQQVPIEHQEFRDDRYVCALKMRPEQEYSIFYLVRAFAPGHFSVPPPLAESMYRPKIRAVGEAGGELRVHNSQKR